MADPRFAVLVRRRAAARCEYCLFPERESEFRFVLDHIVSRQHGGPTDPDNLALACGHCNRHKGPNVSGIDPLTAALTPLFHPRNDRWGEHFAFEGARIVGRTAVGRVTAMVLALNHPVQIAIRAVMIAEGRFPEV